MRDDDQLTFGELTPANQAMLGGFHERVTAEMAKQSINDLVSDALQYRDSRDYHDLLRFMGRFRQYAPFNALLIHSQLKGAAFVAPARLWSEKFERRVKPGQRPIVVLQPFGPVMFVFDVSQTEGEPGAPSLPEEFVNPFAMPPMRGVQSALDWATENAKIDGVRVQEVSAGSLLAGCISTTRSGFSQRILVKRRPPERRDVPVRFETQINNSFSATERYATLAHELSHLYCGHLGGGKPDRWPDRRGVREEVAEFEAESAAYIACQRIDDSAEMPPHLAQYLGATPEVPEGVSLERVAASAGQIVEMSAGWIKPRKRND